MKIVLTGGGTGGHFFPVIAVAESLLKIAGQQGIVSLELYYIGDSAYDTEALKRNNLRYIEIKTGKVRTYASFKNFTDKFLTFFALVKATWKLFWIYPDVVFGKGGYSSFPTIFAARLLRIPVVIHESDTIPGRVNRWAVPYAHNIAISFPDTQKYLPTSDRVALTGNPIRQSLREISKEGSHLAFQFRDDVPVILVIGGSQGSEKINELLVDILPRLLNDYQVIHQSGEAHHVWMKKRTETLLAEHPNRDRYRLYPFLDLETLKHAAGCANLIVARAGSSLFEFALWGIPSILIPLPIAREDHQRENAYSYARTGGAIVIEEANVKPELFFHAIDDTLRNPDVLAKMREGTKQFAHPDAADKIARLLLTLSSKHDS